MTLKDVKRPAESFNKLATSSLDDFAAAFGQKHPDLSAGLEALSKTTSPLSKPKR